MEKQLELKEKYNFKFDEENDCFSFELKNKKAFFVNLNDPIHYNKITPFFMRRGKLGEVVNELFDLNIEQGMLKANDFVSLSIEIIGNMLDESKMGSVEAYINHIWDNAKQHDKIAEVIEMFGAVISMIDITVDKQLKNMSPEEIKKIHENYMQQQLEGYKAFIIKPDGKVVDVFGKDDSEQEDKYDLKNMTPLNVKEI